MDTTHFNQILSIYNRFNTVDYELLDQIISDCLANGKNPEDILITMGYTPSVEETNDIQNSQFTQFTIPLNGTLSNNMLSLFEQIATNLGNNTQEETNTDKKLIKKIMFSSCGISTCKTCEKYDELFGFYKTKYGDEYYKMVKLILKDMFNNNLHLCYTCLSNVSTTKLVVISLDSFKNLKNKYGEYVANDTFLFLAAKVDSVILNYMPHVIPAMEKLLSEGKIDVQYASDFGLPASVLDPYLPEAERQGMSDQSLENFKQKLHKIKNPKDDCVICFNNLAEKTELEKGVECDSTPMKLPCGHEFHWCCISKVIKTRAICPLCNVKVNNDDYDENLEEN